MTGSRVDAADLDDLAADEVRAILVEELAAARERHDQAKAVYAQPNSSREAEQNFIEARGYWRGVARAIERLDEIVGKDGEEPS